MNSNIIPIADLAKYRQAVIEDLGSRVKKPGTSRQNAFSQIEFVNRCITSECKNYGIDDPKIAMPSDDYYRVYKQEEDKFIKSKIKELGVEIVNETGKEINNDTLFSLLQGLSLTKEKLKKIPQIIRMKNLSKHTLIKRGKNEIIMFQEIKGQFNLKKSNEIDIDPKSSSICGAAIHESAHKNDRMMWSYPLLPLLTLPMASMLVINGAELASIPFSALSMLINSGPDLLMKLNKNKIINQISKYATTDRAEFVAETARKVIENNGWDKLSPSIKILYKIMLGPKINLSKTKIDKHI